MHISLPSACHPPALSAAHLRPCNNSMFAARHAYLTLHNSSRSYRPCPLACLGHTRATACALSDFCTHHTRYAKHRPCHGPTPSTHTLCNTTQHRSAPSSLITPSGSHHQAQACAIWASPSSPPPTTQPRPAVVLALKTVLAPAPDTKSADMSRDCSPSSAHAGGDDAGGVSAFDACNNARPTSMRGSNVVSTSTLGLCSPYAASMARIGSAPSKPRGLSLPHAPFLALSDRFACDTQHMHASRGPDVRSKRASPRASRNQKTRFSIPSSRPALPSCPRLHPTTLAPAPIHRSSPTATCTHRRPVLLVQTPNSSRT